MASAKWAVRPAGEQIAGGMREECGRVAGEEKLHECLECCFAEAERCQGADNPLGYAFQKRGRRKRG